MNKRKQSAVLKFGILSLLIVAIFALFGSLCGHADAFAASSLPLPLLAGAVALNNRGRLINFITGVTGVAPGGQAVVNLPVNQRYHKIVFNVIDAGVAVAVNTVVTAVKVIVNGIAIRDILPDEIRRIAIANGYYPKLGELPIFFTEPMLTAGIINEPPDVTSWDLFGQASFQIQLSIKSTSVTPGVSGSVEFDFLRNLRPNGNQSVPFLQPVAKHQFSQPVIVGRNDINTIPFSFPTRRFWLIGSNAGNLSQLEIFQDGNKVFEATQEDLLRSYRQYGFKFALTDTTPAGTAFNAALEASSFYELAYISDPDGRWWRALKAAQSLVLRVTSGAAQTLTIVQETLPGAFAS